MRSLPTALRQAVRAEFSDPRCAYCQSRERLLGLRLEADHIVPAAAGGRAVFSNQGSLLTAAFARVPV
jgi:hypothetical protein